MPSQRSPRTTPKTTSAPPSNGGRRPNGPSTSRRPTGNGGNGKPNGAWPVELVLAAEVELSIEGRTPPSMGSPSARGARPCCPGSEVSRALHERFHELVDAIDQRAG
jgi:hypothetical protein